MYLPAPSPPIERVSSSSNLVPTLSCPTSPTTRQFHSLSRHHDKPVDPKRPNKDGKKTPQPTNAKTWSKCDHKNWQHPKRNKEYRKNKRENKVQAAILRRTIKPNPLPIPKTVQKKKTNQTPDNRSTQKTSTYNITHLLLLCPPFCLPTVFPDPNPSTGSPVPVFLRGPIFLCLLSSRTTSKNARSTLTQFLALASTNSHPSSLANEWPSCVLTSLSVTRSLLFPTSMIGTFAAGDAGGCAEYMLPAPP